jgi:pilus assembly protein CpaD
MTTAKPRLSAPLSVLCGAVLISALLPACMARKVEVTASIPNDLRDRHPIVMSEAPRSIEIFPGPGRLDGRQADDIADFAADYRVNGRSQIIAEVPSHNGVGAAGHRGLMGVREALSRNGVSPALISVRSYPAGHYSVASPIRLSFAKLQARVPHPCGQWPEDLGASNGRFSAENRSYWNLGCATQTNIAAQVANPIDLQRAMAESRIDTVRRMSVVDKIRQGQDPSTAYRDSATRINQTVGN